MGSAVAAAAQGRLFGYNGSGNTLTPTASVASQGGGSVGFFFYGNTLFNVNAFFERFQLQADRNLIPLTSLTIPNASSAAALLNGSRILSIAQTHPDDGHAVITEHDPSGANWILRQKEFSFFGWGQIAGFQDVFFLAYSDNSSGKWNLASYNWNATAPTWQISGLGYIRSLQLSDNNRFLHVGESLNYRIYDVTNPSDLVLLSTIALPTPFSDILISDDYAYLACYGTGILVYDITDKRRPKLIRSYDTPGNAVSLAKIGDRLFVADYQAGIQVLRLPDIVAPQVFITAPVALPQFQTTSITFR